MRAWLPARRSVLVLMVGACAGQAPPPPIEGGPSSEQLPAIQLVHVSRQIDNSPRDIRGGFTVNADGLVLVIDHTSRDLLYSLIDTAGRVLVRMGRRGDGPGEVRGGGIIAADSTFVIASERLVEFDLNGQALRTVVLSFESFPRAFVRPASLLDLHTGGRGLEIGLTSLENGSFQPLVTSAADSFVSRSFGPPLRQGRYTRNPTIGLWDGGIVVGDGWTYRLGLYDWEGTPVRTLRRDIPPPELTTARVDSQVEFNVRSLRAMGRILDAAAVARLRSRLASDDQRHFSFIRPTGLDGHGRIWILGIDADSGFADIFSSHRFLGRLALPCQGFSDGWSLAGRWLVVACLPEDAAFEGDAVFKMFRIEG